MGNESSKEAEVDDSINPSEFNSNTNANCISQVPNNSPASIKTQSGVPMLQSSPSEDAIERDEGPSFRSLSLPPETPHLAASYEPIPNCIPVDLSSQQTNRASAAEFSRPAQPSRVGVDLEQALQALNDPPLRPGYAFITEPSDAALRRPIAPTALHTATEILVNSPVIDADVLASFEVLTPKLDEQSSVLNQLSVSRTKLKPHAPEFIPRRELYDNNVSVTTTSAEITDLEAQHSGLPADGWRPPLTEMSPLPQRQSVFEGRDLPPHLSFRGVNHAYRPVPIRAPATGRDNELDVADKDSASAKNAYPILSTSGIACSIPAELDEHSIPTAATYAEATNLAIQYPAIASEILVQPLASISRGPSLQNNHNATQKLHAPSRCKYQDTSCLTEPYPVAVHSSYAPNWAAAPLSPSVYQAQSPSNEPRKSSRNKRRNESNQNRQTDDGQGYERETSKPIDCSTAWAGPATLEFHESSPIYQQSFSNAPKDLSGQTYEHVNKKVQDASDRPVTPFFHESRPLQQPPVHMQCNFADNPIQHEYLRTVVPSDASSHPVPTVSGSTVEEGAAKLLALAKMNQIDLADLLRLVEYSRTAKEQTDESQFCVQQKLTNELLLGQSAPLPEVQVRTEEVVDDRYWNTPYHMLPKNSWGDTPIINTMVTSPSSVFVPRYTSVPASDTSVSTHGRGASSGGAAVSLKDMTWNEPVDSDRIFAWSSRGGSKHAAFANNPSNSLSGKARSRTSTGDRREPWSHRQVSRLNTKYNHDLENVAAFEVVDKMEGDTKEVFLRHGTHISSKAASSRALADTNHHAEQMRNGRFASEGEGLTAKGGYGTFKTLGRPDVGLERHAVSDHDGVLSWADGGH